MFTLILLLVLDNGQFQTEKIEGYPNYKSCDYAGHLAFQNLQHLSGESTHVCVYVGDEKVPVNMEPYTINYE